MKKRVFAHQRAPPLDYGHQAWLRAIRASRVSSHALRRHPEAKQGSAHEDQPTQGPPTRSTPAAEFHQGMHSESRVDVGVLHSASVDSQANRLAGPGCDISNPLWPGKANDRQLLTPGQQRSEIGSSPGRHRVRSIWLTRAPHPNEQETSDWRPISQATKLASIGVLDHPSREGSVATPHKLSKIEVQQRPTVAWPQWASHRVGRAQSRWRQQPVPAGHESDSEDDSGRSRAPRSFRVLSS